MYKKYHGNGYDPTNHVCKSGSLFGKITQGAGIARKCFSPGLYCLLFFFLLFPASSFAQNERITLSKKDAPLSEVLREIRKQSGFDFVINREQIGRSKRVSIQVKDAGLKDVLDECFRDQPFDYTIENRIIIVINRVKVENKAFLINLKIRVQDQKGGVLPSASVTSKEAGLMGFTDTNGEFVFSRIPRDASVVVSYVGYKSDTLTVKSASEILVMLNQQINMIDEVSVVSTGYQTLSRERATGSFGKPDMQIYQNRVATQDLVSRLDGLVAGVTVIAGPKGLAGNRQFGGGNTQQSIIRGKSTVQALGDPLYVVNGVPVTDLSVINPDDVQDISVLRDASAASIWGVKASNGVIVITTKKGSAGKPLKISYSGNISLFGKPDLDYIPMMNSAQYIETARELFNPAAFPYGSIGTTVIAPHEQILYNQDRGLISAAQAQRSLDSLGNIDNRDQIKDLLFRNAFTTSHTLSASGGSSAYNFYASGSYTNTTSSHPGDQNGVYRLNINQTFMPISRLRISLNTALNNTITGSDRSIVIGSNFIPYQLFQDNAGNNLQMNYVQGLSPQVRSDYQTRSRINLDYSPLDEVNMGFIKGNALSVNLTGNVNLKIWRGLSFDGTYSYQKAPSTSQLYNDSKTYELRRELLGFTVARTANDVPVYYLPTSGGTYKTVNIDQRNYTLRNQLIYNMGLRDGRDRINVQIGHEALEQLATNRTNIARGYDLDLLTSASLNYLALSQGIFGAVSSFRSTFNEKPFETFEQLNRNESFFGLFNYTLNEKYMLDASVRRDYSNLFGSEKGKQRKPTFSVGTKWLISKESFLEKSTWINNLALRTTYGVTGNSPFIGAGSSRDVIQIGRNNVTGDYYSLVGLANNQLTFEKTATVNIGLDFSVLQNALSGSIDLYNKKTTDILGQVDLNPVNGASIIRGNLGNMNNRGLEVTLNSRNLQLKDFSWTTGLTFSLNRNRLLNYSTPQPTQLTTNGRINSNYVVGYGMQPLFAYQFAGLDALGDPQIRLANGTVTKDPEVATAEDLIYMGTTIPKFNGGLSNTFRYKNLSLTANMIYNLGNVMRRDVNRYFYGRIEYGTGSFGGNLSPEFLDRWKKPGDELLTNIPSYVASAGVNVSRRNIDYYTYADINVVSASYIKIRDITLNYMVGPKLLNRLHVESLSLFAQTGNFMIWKANDFGIDPEFQTFNQGGRNMPAFKHSFSFGANLTF
ncbi:SusC/RagA family TonB-linked outer membrane protein [Pedobacter sp. KBS0701]|uniref:SusC/RagA family TonB-linked outer membrane protein n=1 Tax=Pedobacter sp. KBS0701 TaxID=2578106 RepID=UPI00110D7365|nr:SusC/RagA family TonB-linked outer membrane protein [Pedobacter sp. KBS0701]QDW24112.1 SusC/RagA family TonB-linked outer membrane protein [Pedobacter sp. KBS0701]